MLAMKLSFFKDLNAFEAAASHDVNGETKEVEEDDLLQLDQMESGYFAELSSINFNEEAGCLARIRGKIMPPQSLTFFLDLNLNIHGCFAYEKKSLSKQSSNQSS